MKDDFFNFGFMLSFLTCLQSCIFTYDPPNKDVDSRLKIVNKGNKYIYYTVSEIDKLENTGGVELYQTMKKIINGHEQIDTLYLNRIEPDSSINVHYYNNLDTVIYSLPDKKIRVFIFERELLEKYNWKELAKNQLYSKKYVFSIEDLKKLNWTISYP